MSRRSSPVPPANSMHDANNTSATLLGARQFCFKPERNFKIILVPPDNSFQKKFTFCLSTSLATF